VIHETEKGEGKRILVAWALVVQGFGLAFVSGVLGVPNGALPPDYLGGFVFPGILSGLALVGTGIWIGTGRARRWARWFATALYALAFGLLITLYVKASAYVGHPDTTFAVAVGVIALVMLVTLAFAFVVTRGSPHG
jgi:hypothetical protein